MNLAKILAFAFTELPDITTLATEIEAEFHTIAHGEGGQAKIANAVAGAAQIAQAVSTVAAKVGVAVKA